MVLNKNTISFFSFLFWGVKKEISPVSACYKSLTKDNLIFKG